MSAVAVMSLGYVDYRRNFSCLCLLVMMMMMMMSIPVLRTEAALLPSDKSPNLQLGGRGRGGRGRGGDNFDPLLTLPQFADDYSELVMAAVIERNFHNNDLYLVVMLMGHKAFHDMPQRPFLMMKMNSSTYSSSHSSSNNRETFTDKWMKAAKRWNPERKVDLKDSKIHCQFRESNPNNSKIYSSKAYWLPTYLSADNGFNRNLDVLRCKIKASADLNQMLNRYNDKKYISRRKLFVTLERRTGGDNGGSGGSGGGDNGDASLSEASSTAGLEKVISFTVP